MPIPPPNLDDRRFEEIVAEARALIPEYCPQWTNLGDANPGITLVQLFAWMTEMTIYRLNRVPDKTYIHFLNFIGEERRPALPARVPVTFTLRTDTPCEIPTGATVATRQREDRPAQVFLTADALTVHNSHITRIMAVRGGSERAVREVPFTHLQGHPGAQLLGGGRGVQVFDLDPQAYGPQAYTPYQYLYVGHDDLRIMDIEPAEGRDLGRLRIRRSAEDDLSIVAFFDWEYPTAEGWLPIGVDRDAEEVLGMPEQVLLTALPGIVPVARFSEGDNDFPVPERINSQKYWVRGRLDYERWLASRMLEDLEVSWQDDRGGELRTLHNWEARATGRTLEFYLQDLPPVRDGWTVRLALIDRGVPAGRNGYLPKYRWSYRRGESWERIPVERVRAEGTLVVLTGPFTEMATDGFNVRAERLETVFLRGIAPDLELSLDWIRPVEIHMLAGDDPRRTETMLMDEGPWSPFQVTATMQPTIGRKWFVGSDLFENRRQAPVLVEIEIGFEVNGEPVEEPVDDYLLQLTYRADDNWRVVYSKDKVYTGFTFGTLDAEGAKKKGRRRVRLVLDPKTQLKGLARHVIGDTETTWIRFELIKSNLRRTDDDGQPHPVVPRIHQVRLGADKTLGDGTYEQPMPNPRIAEVDHRQRNRRLTRCLTRTAGRLSESFPFYPFVEIEEENLALYLQFDKPLPRGSRHAIHFRCRGEAFLPEGASVDWEILEARAHGKTSWRRLLSGADAEGGVTVYQLDRTGVLEFALPELPDLPEEGFWLRARFVVAEGMDLDQLPALPPITHVMLNTVDAVNLVTVSDERHSGLGVPNQVVRLNRNPIFVHPQENEKAIFKRPELFTDIRVWVDEGNGDRHEWTLAREGNLLTAGKDDRVFVADTVDGTLSFGNGIRGRMLPVGTHNLIVETYRVVPGSRGNVGHGDITVAEGFGDTVKVGNLLPAAGGRDAESIDEILRRAPSLLTSRDRAVTRQDFEIIAAEASGEVARAACPGKMGEDGTVEVVILPHRREDEPIPDPFLSAGLRDHVQSYLARRCLINVEPKVRLATFMPVDISVSLRLRPNANQLMVREAAERWVRRFLDAYEGGLDRDGWPFGASVYAQDFARLVSDLPEVRHVVDVQLYDMSDASGGRAAPGWEEGEGLRELALEAHDLFVLRRVQVITEEGDR